MGRYRIKGIRFGRICRASTLVEVMVAVMVSGVIFLSVFEGWNLFQRYKGRIGKMISASDRILFSYQCLDGLFSASDSVLMQRERFDFYRRGVIYYAVMKCDSLLIHTNSEQNDTLFRHVAELRVVPDGPEPVRIDSLYISLNINRKNIRLAFGRVMRSQDTAERRISELEEKHEITNNE